MTVQASATLPASLRQTDHPRQTADVIQQEIDRQANDGGGLVMLPPGEWVVTTIELRSGITLHLPRGCVLKAHPDLADYEPWSRGHNASRQAYHMIRADGCEFVTIEGDGVIDGQGELFWERPLRDLKAEGVDISDDIARAPGHWPLDGPFWRGWKPRISPLVELRHCRHLVLRDVTIRNSPGWTLHPYCCDFVRIDGVTIDNHIYGPNTDGIDVNGCRDVFIANCRIIGCDDNIILKATEDARTCERVTVTNCSLKTNCAALGLGAETTQGIRDIAFSNCVVEQALRMIQFEMWEPGLIENVAISNISGRTMTPDDVPMEKVIYLDIQQHRRPEPTLGRMRGITISGVTATTQGRCVLTAQEGAWIEDVILRDIVLDYPAIEDAAALAPDCRCNQNSNYNPEAQAANAVLVAENVRGLRVHDLIARMPPADAGVPGMHGLWLSKLEDAMIRTPGLRSNHPDTPSVVQRDCRNVSVDT